MLLNNDVYNIIVTREDLTYLKSLGKEESIKKILELSLDHIMRAEELLNPPKELKEDGNKRNGYREITCNTLIGELTLHVPKLRKGTFHPLIEDGLNHLEEMYDRAKNLFYVIGVPTRYVGKLFEQPGLKYEDKSAVSRQNRKEPDPLLEEFCTRSFDNQYYSVVFLDAMYVRMRFGNKRNDKAAVIAAVGIDEEGKQCILDIEPVSGELKQTYYKVLMDLKKRGLKDPALIISDGHIAIKDAVGKIFPGTLWQRCAIHLMRETKDKIKNGKNRAQFSLMLKKV